MIYVTDDFGRVMGCKTYEELQQVADTMISAKPDVLSLDAAIPNLCYYRSAVGHYWSRKNMDALYQAGHDPLEVMVKKFKNAGITVLAGIRMNDHHGGIDIWTPWDQEHKDWSLAKDTGNRDWRAVGDLRQMDYAIAGVREHRLAIIKEIVARYDVDGIQLDFGRSAPFLSEVKREKAKHMTQYLKDIRSVLDDAGNRRGHRMILGAILPWGPDFCEREGLEVQRWIHEELVSYVSPGEWYYSDWNIPLADWGEILQGTACKLVPFMLGNVSPYQKFEQGKRTLLGDNRLLDGSKIRAIAESFYAQGADGIMFYNFYSDTFGSYYPFLRTWTDPDTIASMSRHYFFCRRLKYVPTEHYSFGTGEAFDRFPLDKVGDEAEYSFRFAAKAAGSTRMLRFKLKNMSAMDKISVRMNGEPLAPDRIVKQDANADGGVSFTVAIWEASVSMPPLRCGNNTICVRLEDSAPNRQHAIEVGEFEVLVTPIAK
ncbi:MAG: family 10 glycosylhydrolase [Kiritimatiellaeota bacterium]|nr:family 10 glycosylhydrolase [Kiritimatiellota bacterium]